jgi:multicomponent Na+:H+ antiporter subunit A
MWIGPAIFGLCGVAVVFALSAYGDTILAPAASAIVGHHIDAHLSLAVDPLGLPLWLSVITWVISGLVYWQIDRVRAVLAGAGRRLTWTFDGGFDRGMLGLLRLSTGWTRAFHNGRLEIYLVVTFAALALALWLPIALLRSWPALPTFGALHFYDWGAIGLAVAGLAAVILSPTRLVAILALGLQGLALGLIFIFFGAPDLGFTQLLIEVLSVVILAFVMTRLHLSARDPRPLEDWLRDGVLALICGAGVAMVLLRVVQGDFDDRLSEFFAANSATIAHGRNIVNVILVDYRGLDTLGEITVVLTVGVGVLAMLRRQHKRKPPATEAAPALAPPPAEEVTS